jgi:hypothetical protein
MIDLAKEAAFTLAAATKLPELQRNGRRPHTATIFRWASRGISRGGKTVRLETVRQGGAMVTTRESLRRFFAALSGEHVPEQDRQREHEDAEAALAAAGI